MKLNTVLRSDGYIATKKRLGITPFVLVETTWNFISADILFTWLEILFRVSTVIHITRLWIFIYVFMGNANVQNLYRAYFT